MSPSPATTTPSPPTSASPPTSTQPSPCPSPKPAPKPDALPPKSSPSSTNCSTTTSAARSPTSSTNADCTAEPENPHRKIIDNIIRAYRLRTRRQRFRDQGWLTPAEMAARLDITASTLKAWRRAGLVTAVRYNDKGESLYQPPDPDNQPQRPRIGRPPKTS
ncbi:MerR family transcriptional regulator [Nocardia vinacea]|uniref:MerR family transcriptional regulator n=1 Tax=Nocardia vinacea TaxID=96468 RepID=UPI003F4E1537